ncbi:hypothetical protein TTHERM_000717819 (macronuclear) [Tetrahymena thermophila SB210]|uniref:Kinase domain protein n=1 Tax=Tetrahymena thermophila (strain SB210) TaxID=312017 RepID=W7X8J7_TETTS|nr:hypothetical protein TTHERM_000717819 [Tetrahymena thermophila SB210]EWS73677.1 hypothetical protein TTHERM_000717819 [Tetrahymena thermophila SB210]|eukprot:XP_012653807.1 hypothetical protein TTHERM_000717819 [Tetrahymena thermophila SB210]
MTVYLFSRFQVEIVSCQLKQKYNIFNSFYLLNQQASKPKPSMNSFNKQRYLHYLQHRKFQYYKCSMMQEKRQQSKRQRCAAIYLKYLSCDEQKQIEKFEGSECLFIDWWSDGRQLFESNREFCFKQLSINVEKLVGVIDFQNLSKFLSCFPNLEDFEVKIPYQFQIGEQEAVYFGEGLKNLANLQNLSLCINVNQRGAELLGDTLVQLKKLQGIKIKLAKFQNVGDLGIQRICQGIQTSKEQLKMLSLQIGYFNQIGQLGVQSIAKCIRQLDMLEFLNLNIKKNNDLDAAGFSDVYESIQSRKLLKCLALTLTVPDSVQINQLQNKMECKDSLQKYFVNLDLHDLNMIFFCKSLIQFSNLQEITINLNYSQQLEAIIQIAESLEYIRNIKTLIIRSQRIQYIDIPIKVLQPYIKTLSQIVFLHLDFQLSYYNQPLRQQYQSFYKTKRLVEINIT